MKIEWKIVYYEDETGYSEVLEYLEFYISFVIENLLY